MSSSLTRRSSFFFTSRLSETKTPTSRIKSLLSDFAPSNALALFFPTNVQSLLPSDSDAQQEYTIQHVRRYVCMLLVGVGCLVGEGMAEPLKDPYGVGVIQPGGVGNLKAQFEAAPPFYTSDQEHKYRLTDLIADGVNYMAPGAGNIVRGAANYVWKPTPAPRTIFEQPPKDQSHITVQINSNSTSSGNIAGSPGGGAHSFYISEQNARDAFNVFAEKHFHSMNQDAEKLYLGIYKNKDSFVNKKGKCHIHKKNKKLKNALKKIIKLQFSKSGIELTKHAERKMTPQNMGNVAFWHSNPDVRTDVRRGLLKDAKKYGIDSLKAYFEQSYNTGHYNQNILYLPRLREKFNLFYELAEKPTLKIAEFLLDQFQNNPQIYVTIDPKLIQKLQKKARLKKESTQSDVSRSNSFISLSPTSSK